MVIIDFQIIKLFDYFKLLSVDTIWLLTIFFQLWTTAQASPLELHIINWHALFKWGRQWEIVYSHLYLYFIQGNFQHVPTTLHVAHVTNTRLFFVFSIVWRCVCLSFCQTSAIVRMWIVWCVKIFSSPPPRLDQRNIWIIGFEIESWQSSHEAAAQ